MLDGGVGDPNQDDGEDKDEEFCRGALDGTGFYTDLPEREQEPDVKLR